jgi:capsular polysaccharide transport system ATP-binding protein
MIELRNISKAYRTLNGWHQVFENISLTLPTDRNIGILGLNGAGKSTLLRLISGVESPDSGEIYRDVRVSYPIGFKGGFQNWLSGRENARFIGRIHGIPLKELEEFVQEFTELGEYYDMPIKTYSSGMRGRLAFAVSMAIDFDCYLADEINASGDRRFKAKYHETFVEKHRQASMIMVSHQSDAIKKFCDMSAVIHGGEIHLFDTVKQGMEFYENF